ncbi:MAG: hypothetical protein M1829_002136, partial [Trizodia sp. TS-e1964]
MLLVHLLFVSLAAAATVPPPPSSSSSLTPSPSSTKPVDVQSAPVGSSNLTASASAGAGASALPPVVANTARSRCPASCHDSGLDPFHWTVYHSVERLSWCNQTMLLDFALFNPLADPRTHVTIRCCAAGVEAAISPGVAASSGASGSLKSSAGRIARRDNPPTDESPCSPNGSFIQVKESLNIKFNGSGNSASTHDFLQASQQLANYLDQKPPTCHQSVLFAYSGSAVVGLFAGSGVRSASSVLKQFIASVQGTGYSDSVLVQLCPGIDRSSRYSMGIIANAHADVAFVQNAVAAWEMGKCVDVSDRADIWHNITMSIPNPANSTHGNATTLNGTYPATFAARALSPRADCNTVKVAAGDSCSTLASECGITPTQFTSYNPSPSLCSSLAVGQHVCCSAGTLPDFTPKPNANGTCATYFVIAGDYCSKIAATYSISLDQLTSFNTKTWGWMGCADLQAGSTICLSSGSPPMPAVIKNAVCGPQAPGTALQPAGTDYSMLNQCPLNACCDIWGQCGITAEFCTVSISPTGAPGTAAVGANGCISNCGTQIVTGSPPAAHFKVGYFEGFNSGRPCLNQPINQVDLSAYTHVHLAFATITSSFGISVAAIQAQFDAFVAMQGFKRVISIGGWAFSTDPATYGIFRSAVSLANVETLAANIVTFVENYQLDGVDIDWEYPAEPDIPGIPAGTLADSLGYVTLVGLLKAKLPPGVTVSFCAPASFWYLQGFFIKQMEQYVDYVTYMAYDLHGQWDYNNAFSDPGCPGGNCLRSDVNLTETISALSMITKAGMPANKIVVGVTSYGRSFQMTTPGCHTEMCTYTGPDSGAYAGLCTQTHGYISNAEIIGILSGNAVVTSADGSNVAVTGTLLTYYDASSQSDIVVYQGNQWIAYMSDATKSSRENLYKSYNFLGTADWAIDLQSYAGDTGSGSGSGSSSIISISPSIWTLGNPVISCNPPCIFVLPPYPLGSITTVSWPILTTTLLSLSSNSIFTITTTISVPPFIMTAISLQPITMAATDTATYQLYPVQSVTPTSFTYTLGPNLATIPPTSIPGSAGDGIRGGQPSPSTSTSSTTAAAVIPGVSFHPTPFPVLIQPQPTYSVDFKNIPTPIPPLTITTGKPPSPCVGPGCGSRPCGIFGCTPGCGLFGCDGGCSIFGCGGGCGPLGCIPSCPLNVCGGPGCIIPGSCGGSGGTDGTDGKDDCPHSLTFSACTYIVSSSSTSTSCSTTTACKGADTKTTKNPDACSASVYAAYSSAAAAAATIFNGQQIPLALFPTVPPGAVETPTVTAFGISLSSTTSNCEACTYANGNKFQCSFIGGCTETVTVTTTVMPTKTTTIIVPPTVTADCAFWGYTFFFVFEVYNIAGWSPDGNSLHDQENGCGALTFWEWHGAADNANYAYAYFDLPILIKAGCVERAIVSAGGPKLQCQLQDNGFFRERRQLALGAGNGVAREKSTNHPAALSKRATRATASRRSLTATPTYSYSLSVSSSAVYVPMSWDPNQGNTAIFTQTFSSTSVYTTQSVIANGTTVRFTISSTVSTSEPASKTSLTNPNTSSISSTSKSSSPTSSSKPSSTSVTPPGPTQPGIISTCNKYYLTVSGDSCSAIETKYSISFAQFYAWNPA